MAASTYPPAASGVIKSIQRGQALSAGNITITSVDTSKTFVTSFSEGAAGTVTSDSTITGTLNPSGGNIAGTGATASPSNTSINAGGSFQDLSGSRTLGSGTMNATTKRMGAYLSNSTTLVATGPCRWEVVEFM